MSDNYLIKNKIKCEHNANRYVKFIKSRIELNKSRDVPKGKYEVHHIILRSMGGSDDRSNLVKLTLREHFIAHLMLFLCYRNKQTANALRLMSNCNNYFNSRLYDRYRSAANELLMGSNNPMYNKVVVKIGDSCTIITKDEFESGNYISPNKGRIHTEETRKLLSEMMTGSNSHRYGKKLDDSIKKKISKSHMGKTHTEDTKKKISETRRKTAVDVRGNNSNAKKASIDGVVYGCIKDAMEALNISLYKINKRFNSDEYSTWFLID